MDNIIRTLSETINTNAVSSTVGESTMGLNVVGNLSSRELSRGEVALLSKGLKFCPTPNELDVFALRKDINYFVRRIRLRDFFYDPDAVDADFSETPGFRKKSSWCPEKGREIAIEAYAKALEEKILSSTKQGKIYRNLTQDERRALKDLRYAKDIVIKEADKGSGVVVMD
ncbi:predicted protein [Nematostella vectensis]|uniref:Uncharacterized protein n=1 Tax=Nematostella vectensis TaxID=45351 RepID=A7S858_NEMVE|nr:predicted protein [Nematostella vectensis]|eukprot:XP_001632171.1 predicted protein [Nematostella vectensis]